MSTEEAVQEVRRIFMNNSVEQAHDYLKTITRGIQESDERLKQIVGQSYRDLIVACDRVVGMDQTCRNLLSLQRRLRASPLGSNQSDGKLLDSADTTLTALETLGTCECGEIVPQQRCVSLEGLLGAHDVCHAATVLCALRGSNRDAQCVAYMDRLECTMRELLYSDADGAAMRHAAIVHRAAGIPFSEKYFSAINARVTVSPSASGDETETIALAHMAEVHKALTIVQTEKERTTTGSAASALLRLIELVAVMLQTDLDLVTAAAEQKKKSTANTNIINNNSNNSHSVQMIGMDWLLAVLPLPLCIREQCDGMTGTSREQAWLSLYGEVNVHEEPNPSTTATTTRTITQTSHRSVVMDAVIALHVLQRAQFLFFHLAMYVASVANKLFGATDDTASKGSVLPMKLDDKHDETEEDEFAHFQRQRRAMQNLITLRGRLISQQHQQQQQQQQYAQEQQVKDLSANDIASFRRSSSLAREALSTPHRQKSEALLDDSSSLLSIDAVAAVLSEEDAARRNRTRASYLREVMLQVCGLQALDPYCVRQDKGKSNALPPNTESSISKTESNGHTPAVDVSYERIRVGLAGVQDIVARLMSAIAEGGFMRDPRCIGAQEQLSRHGALRLQQGLTASAELHPNAHGDTIPVDLLFDAAKWNTATSAAGERALLMSIGAALKKTERIAASILQRTRARHQRINSNTLYRMTEEEERVVKQTKGILNVPVLSRRLLRQSLSVSECIARAHGSNGYTHPHKERKRQSMGHCSITSSFSATRFASNGAGSIQGSSGDSNRAKHRAMDATLARVIAQRAWSHQKSIPATGKMPYVSVSSLMNSPLAASNNNTGVTSQCSFGNTMATPLGLHFPETDIFDVIMEGENGIYHHHHNNNSTNKKNDNLNANRNDIYALGYADDAAAALFADDESFNGALPHNDSELDTMDAKKNLKSEEAEEGEEGVYDGAADRGRLRSMLQRIFIAAHVMKTSKTAARGLITNWISTVLKRVQDVMRSEEQRMLHEKELEQRQEQQRNVEERCVINESHTTWAMVVFDRLSMLVEVILQIVESMGGEDESNFSLLVEQLRSTVVACHQPWIKLLRDEWQQGICVAYREAFAISTGKRFALVYATGWRYSSTSDATSKSSHYSIHNCNNPLPDTDPSHSHSHMTEQQQQQEQEHSIGYPVHTTPHVSELLFLLQHILHATGTNRHMEATILPIVRREILEATATAIRDTVLPTLPGGDDLLLQLTFDLRYVIGLFVVPQDPDAAALCDALLRVFESRVDPVVWSLAFPPLCRASDGLLRATALSFGAWSPIAAADMWSNTTARNSTSIAAANGAICAPNEVQRFPLLPLATGGSSHPATRPLAHIARNMPDATVNTLREGSGEKEREAVTQAKSSSLLGGDKTARGWMNSLW